jgi:hypothetical protein
MTEKVDHEGGGVPEQFAKLFERNGQQVLVTKDEDEDGEPALKIRFKSNVSGHDICIKVAFRKDAELDKWAVMDRAFDAMDISKAFDFRDGAPGVGL